MINPNFSQSLRRDSNTIFLYHDITTALTITLLKAMQIIPIDQTLHTSRSGSYASPFSRVAIRLTQTLVAVIM